MKRLAALLLIFLLSGCGAPVPAIPDVRTDDVLASYAQAARAYDWFGGISLPLDSSDTRQEKGVVYARVDSPEISSLSELHAFLERRFSSEIVSALFALSPDQYRDFDGVLYGQEGARGDQLYLYDTTVTAAQTDADHWTVTLTFWADSWEWERPRAVIGYSTAVLDYARTPEGWKFTSFCGADDLDLNADTMFHFMYDIPTFDATDFGSWSVLQLALYLLHADGALTEGASDEFFFCFLGDPAAVLQALSLLPPAWQETVSGLLAGAAWSWHPDSGFEAILEAAIPADDAEQKAADTLRWAYAAAQAANPAAPASAGMEFSLIVPGEKRVLTLGPQEGTFPWGYHLKGTLTHSGSTDTYGTVYERDCGDVQISYFVSPDDETEYLYKLSTALPYDRSQGYFCTARGLYCGDSEESLRRSYLPAKKLEAFQSDVYDACYVYEPGGDAFCKHIAFYLKDGLVAYIEMEDLLDGRLLDS